MRNAYKTNIYINKTWNNFNGESHKDLFWGLLQPIIKKKWKICIEGVL